MKPRKYLYIITFLAAAILSACDKTVLEPTVTAYQPTSLNPEAAQWQPFLVGKDKLTVPSPSLPTSAAYLQELAATKALTAKLTADQQRTVDYWSSGAVYRWNQLARELAAKYNLPPASNKDGIYPVPDPKNPLADPVFPFANPPYTARMLSYLGVAQYDALVAAWHYKYLFNRKNATTYDATIQVNQPVSNLPAYPSAEAVVGEVSFQILSAMFPGEIPYLTAKLEEATNALRWGGVYVESDITVGKTLGNSVASQVMARAKTDGMGAANNQALVPSQMAAAKLLGIKDLWVSQEVPARPPMLPNYGAVMTWNFDRKTLEDIRPKLPYVVDSPEWKKELEELKQINKKQTREQARIANYWSDGAGSYTPPGHWNRMAANLAFKDKLSEVAMARVMALVGTTLMDAGVACWDTKYHYYTPRPQQFGVKTSVGLPNFPSYTSGHSTFSAAAATLLGHLFPTEKDALMAKAKEASDSRVYGLIHFRVDCEMGLVHGAKIGQYAINRADKQIGK